MFHGCIKSVNSPLFRCNLALLGETVLLSFFSKENAMGHQKPVPVVAYTRRRFGRIEHVCRHFRSYPRR